MCADKVFAAKYQSDGGQYEADDGQSSDDMDCVEDFDFHKVPHDKADVVVALATVQGI